MCNILKTMALFCLDIPYDLKMMCSDMLSMHTIWSLSIYFFWFVTSNFFFHFVTWFALNPSKFLLIESGQNQIDGTIPTEIGELRALTFLHLGESECCVDFVDAPLSLCWDRVWMFCCWSIIDNTMILFLVNLMEPDLPSIHPNFFSLNQDMMFLPLIIGGMQIKKNLLEKFQHRSETLFYWKNYFCVS